MDTATQEITVLKGHIDEATAYLVEDYPYGFRLRTKIHYWIETHPKHGDRFCSQTLNPKVAYPHWNKPKKSTYAPVIVLYLNEDGYVKQHVLRTYTEADELKSFLGFCGPDYPFNESQRRQICYITAYANRNKEKIPDQLNGGN